ncbi:MAG: FtsX-like permease family protein [Bacteroides sp.]|nr:FtsX-like permease family protein [Bacteroides sp.]
MFKIIFHQIWNQRRMNAWIFIELLIVSFFLWIVVDPVCVLTATMNIPSGYEIEGRYVVKLNMYEETHGKYDAEAAKNDSLKVEHYNHVARLIRDLPEVESLAIPVQLSFPGSGNWSGGQLFRDTADVAKKDFVHMQRYQFVKEGNPFATYGMRDVRTGEYLIPNEELNGIYISENLALELFGTADCVGRSIYTGQEASSSRVIAGVFQDYKHFDFTQPYPMGFYYEGEIEASPWMQWCYPFVFKLKAGVDEETFRERFIREVAPQFNRGNIYFSDFMSFQEIIDECNELRGPNNKIRLSYILAGFAMLCIFLGMLGTFWIRSDARRQEIGVMRSMGANRHRIIKQFLMEATLLVSLAFLCSIPLLLYYAHIKGMYVAMGSGLYPILSEKYWMNNFCEHFGLVSMVTYAILLGISLLGTLIPVVRASRILPADALRDE